jgi:hypothetical protein
VRSLDRLREQRAAFLAAVDAAPAVRPYAHLLRDMVDARPRTAKIAEAILARLGGISMTLPTSQVVYIVRCKLERDLPALPLAAVPCDVVIRWHVRERIEKSLNLGGQVSPMVGALLSNGST